MDAFTHWDSFSHVEKNFCGLVYMMNLKMEITVWLLGSKTETIFSASGIDMFLFLYYKYYYPFIYLCEYTLRQ